MITKRREFTRIAGSSAGAVLMTVPKSCSKCFKRILSISNIPLILIGRGNELLLTRFSPLPLINNFQ